MSKKEKELKKNIQEKLDKIEKETNDRNDEIKGGDKSKELKEKLAKSDKELEEQKDLNMRLRAEFDNYKRRTQKEKEAIYSDSVTDIIKVVLPVIDNFERALESDTDDVVGFKDGMQMIYRQLKDVLKNSGVEEIKALGEKFDPMLHNAVMHVEDEELSDNVVIEEFQKGYKIGDKVIRHSMVKVAN